MRRFVMVAVIAAATCGWASRAEAQGVGVRAGVSGDPDQFYVGVHAETPHLFEQVHFRPNVELGLGQDQRLLAVNFEFVYRARLSKQPWAVLIGAGPAANIATRDRANGSNVTTTGGGLNVLIGLEHAQGFFTELKVGFIDSPGIKFGVGYTFR